MNKYCSIYEDQSINYNEQYSSQDESLIIYSLICLFDQYLQQSMEQDNQPLHQINQSQPVFSQEEQRDSSISFNKIRPYWNEYFTTAQPEDLNLTLPLHKIIFAFKCATSKPYFEELFKVLDYDRLYYEASLKYDSYKKVLAKHSGDDLVEALNEILSTFQYDASAIIQAISIVLHSYLVEVKRKKAKKVCLIIENYPLSDINQVKAHMIDNFISFETVVLKVYQIKLMAVSLEFDCPDCKDTFIHYLSDGNFTQPNRCKGSKKKECKSKIFIMRKDKVKSIFMQRIKVQEIDSQGRTPRQIICEMRENMVGKIITGQTIRLSGIIKTQTSDEKDKKTQAIFVPYILANSIVQKTKNSNLDYDMNLVKEMKQNPNIFYSLIKSFCPTIYGHDIVKAGLILGVVGGSSKSLSDQSTFRQSSHILLLGDPGIGKSQLLKFAAQLLPHSIYVNATATSTSGLTVTVNRDNNQQSLQAGALILADHGICAIDQFDKISDSSSLLQAMQQQTVSIAKAGVICQLKCRVGVIASANPINGCYNKAKSFKDNTKISNAILSRFDLIFLLVDKPDPERDRKLAEHIMKIHNNKRKRKAQQNQTSLEAKLHPSKQYKDYLSLSQKYAQICEAEQQTYSLQKIKKYLNYVKKQIHPTLTQQACQVIKGFYLILRQNSPNTSFQITNRQLQSMIRLAMARARIECRTEVTDQDAIEITQLMQQSLFDSFEEMGYNINSLKYEVKKAKIYKKNSQLSLPKQRNLFISQMREKMAEKDSNIWEWSDLVRLAKELELNISDFYAFIERLNQDGVLLQKGNKRYAFQDSFV